MYDAIEITRISPAKLYVSEEPVQQIHPFNSSLRFEGIAFSPSGDELALVASDQDAVFLFRRLAGGKFDPKPSSFISGVASGFTYPHDASYCDLGNVELLAVAQRVGAVAILERPKGEAHFRRQPTFKLVGKNTRLNHSDGVSFVPPNNTQLAVCNLADDTISFFQQSATSPVEFDPRPASIVQLETGAQPDGLAFSASGRWLAIANHGNNTVSIFERSTANDPTGYGPAAHTVLSDPSLICPHSVAFTVMDHLVVTCAGANYFGVYSSSGSSSGLVWSREPVIRRIVGSESMFRKVNALNKMEGGAKGVAVHGSNLAICSPEHGVKIYRLHEG
jgi:hypothetical protein